MKRWYCPRCRVFKRTSKTIAGFMGYPDEHVCRCCGEDLVDAKAVIWHRDVVAVLEAAERQLEAEANSTV